MRVVPFFQLIKCLEFAFVNFFVTFFGFLDEFYVFNYAKEGLDIFFWQLESYHFVHNYQCIIGGKDYKAFAGLDRIHKNEYNGPTKTKPSVKFQSSVIERFEA